MQSDPFPFVMFVIVGLLIALGLLIVTLRGWLRTLPATVASLLKCEYLLSDAIKDGDWTSTGRLASVNGEFHCQRTDDFLYVAWSTLYAEVHESSQVAKFRLTAHAGFSLEEDQVFANDAITRSFARGWKWMTSSRVKQVLECLITTKHLSRGPALGAKCPTCQGCPVSSGADIQKVDEDDTKEVGAQQDEKEVSKTDEQDDEEEQETKEDAPVEEKKETEQTKAITSSSLEEEEEDVLSPDDLARWVALQKGYRVHVQSQCGQWIGLKNDTNMVVCLKTKSLERSPPKKKEEEEDSFSDDGELEGEKQPEPTSTKEQKDYMFELHIRERKMKSPKTPEGVVSVKSAWIEVTQEGVLSTYHVENLTSGELVQILDRNKTHPLFVAEFLVEDAVFVNRSN